MNLLYDWSHMCQQPRKTSQEALKTVDAYLMRMISVMGQLRTMPTNDMPNNIPLVR